MRILMTTDTVGGVWTYSQELSTQLLANGCSVAMVSFGREPSFDQREWANGKADRWGERFVYIASETPLEWMEQNHRAYGEAAPLLLDLAGKFGADLLLSSQYCFGALDCAIPKVVVAHSDVLSWAEACDKGELAPSEWLNRYRSLVQEGLRRADAVVAPTQWMLRALAEHFELPREAHVIPNGRTLFEMEREGSRKLQTITAGRVWDEGKNLQILTDLAPVMPMLIAGEIEHESSRFSDFDGHAELLGPLPERELLELFRSSSIYICTSKYEPFGLAPLEAAQCGCAVVANGIPSLREVWGDSALFFDGSDSLGLLLTRLKQDAQLLGERRERSHNHARAFTADRMAAGYLHMFDSLLTQAAVA